MSFDSILQLLLLQHRSITIDASASVVQLRPQLARYLQDTLMSSGHILKAVKDNITIFLAEWFTCLHCLFLYPLLNNNNKRQQKRDNNNIDIYSRIFHFVLQYCASLRDESVKSMPICRHASPGCQLSTCILL